jgi:WD40 repeat protein
MALAGHDDPSTRRLYSSSTLGEVHVWNLDSLTRMHSFFSKGHEICTDLIVIDAMDQLAAGCLDGKIYMMDLHLHQPVKTLCGHRQGVTVLRYSSENGYIISGGVDQSIYVWNPHVETKIGSLMGHRHQLIGVEVVPNSPQIVSADESGTVKIWDLRKFSCLQTISRDTYVKDQDVLRMRTRPMKAMSYFESKKRIAVAHSVIHFLDESSSQSAKESFSRSAAPVASVLKSHVPDRAASGTRAISKTADLAMEFHENRENASRIPVGVIVSDATHCVVAVAALHITTWDLSTGALMQCVPSGIEFEITSVAEVDDQYTCFVGTERGTIARLMFPGAAVITHKKVSESEITALKWVAHVRYLTCSLGDTGNILVLRSESFEKVYTLNHWRSARCVLNQISAWSIGTANSKESQQFHENDLFVPAHLRSFFQSSELGWFKKLFVSAAPSPDSTTADNVRALEVLDSVIPSLSDANLPGNHPRLLAASAATAATVAAPRMTFAAFLEEMKRRIQLFEDGRGPTEVRKKLCEISCVDVNASALCFVSGSSADGTFCVWNLRNGTVLSAGQPMATNPGGAQVSDGDPYHSPDCLSTVDIDPRLAQVCCLDPLPYFALLSGSTRSSISIWLSAAQPPTFPHPFQRIVDHKHRHCMAAGCVNPRIGSEQTNGDSDLGGLVTTMAWHFDRQSNEMLIAVGDEKGGSMLVCI